MFDLSSPSEDRPIPLQQSAVFNDALPRLGISVVVHAFAGGRAAVMVRRLPLIGAFGLVSRGPVWDGEPPARRAEGFAGMRRALGLSCLVVNPERAEDAAAMRAAGFIRIGRAGRVAMLPLDGGPSDWIGRMDGKWRNRLRRAQGADLVAERHDFSPQGGHWLFDRDRAQQTARNYRSLPHRVLAEIARGGPGAAQLFLARRGREVVAAMLFLRHGTMATYQVGWSSPQGRSASAHNLLMWEAMQALSAQGIRRIDLGVMDPKRTPGIDRFKTGAGGMVQVLGGTWIDSAVTRPLAPIVAALSRRGP
ncbi:GNAT family N-acetyltransferase [Rhodobacterales bacterium HKCCE2091]|nr:GNAT family N-acetyltransferase [Rhodobacterales bacterium HKCCE2091]